MHSDYTVAYSVFKKLNRSVAHLTAGNSVTNSWRTAALNMTEDCRTAFNAGDFLNFFSHFRNTANALGNNDNEMSLSCFLGSSHSFDNIALKVEINLGNKNCSSAAGNTRIESYVSRTPAHYLDNRATVVRLSGITQTVNHFHNGVHCGIIADCIITAGNIVVNGAGNTHARNSPERKVSRASEGTVSADDNNALHTELLTGINRLLHTLFSLEFGTSCRIKNCTAAIYYI